MTQEEFQRLVLEKLVSLESGQTRMETRIEKMEIRMENIETRMEKMETRMENIETRMESIETRMEKMETRMESIETRQEKMEVRQIQQESQLQEIIKFQQASILETIEYIHDRLVTKDDLHASMKTLNDRLFVQEVELNKLKLVK